MEIFFIRHTETIVEKGICYGISNVSLKDTSFSDFQRNKLPEHFDRVYSSPLTRCKLLANHLSVNNSIEDDRLTELNFGDWEMKAWKDIPESELTPWMNDFVTIASPNGESFIQLSKRCNSFIKDLRLQTEKTVAVVAHAGTIRALLAEILSIPLNDCFKLSIDFGSIIHVELNQNKAFDKLITFNL